MFARMFVWSIFDKFMSLLNDREPLMYIKVDLSNENEIFVRIKFVVAEYSIFRFSEIICDNLLKNALHSSAIPPLVVYYFLRLMAIFSYTDRVEWWSLYEIVLLLIFNLTSDRDSHNDNKQYYFLGAFGIGWRKQYIVWPTLQSKPKRSPSRGPNKKKAVREIEERNRNNRMRNIFQQSRFRMNSLSSRCYLLFSRVVVKFSEI